MKVAVITRHAVTNYGSLLQAMATQKMIEDLGHSCEIIDYIRDDESFRQHEKNLLKRKEAWNHNPIKKGLYLAIRQPESIAAGRRFEKARQKYLKLSARYTSAEALKRDPPGADVYMTGSDQVWGPVGDGIYDDSYCLSFAEGKKIAYAASFGHTEMTTELRRYYKKWLSEYSSISVREDSAVKILNELHIEARQVLDPVLLLSAGYWKRYFKPIKHRRYILVYQLHNDKRLGKYAARAAKEKGIPLVRISPSFHQAIRPGKLVWCPEIGEFLSYVKNAECLITDSFHGTAFAINFNTPFVEVLPDNHTQTRNLSILRLTDLSNRILQDEDNIELADEKIDFTFANSVIAEQRAKSVTILRRMLGA